MYKVWDAEVRVGTGHNKSQMCLYPLHQRMCIILVEFIARLVFLPMHVHSCQGEFLIRVSGTRARLSRRCVEPRGRNYVVVDLQVMRLGCKEVKVKRTAYMRDNLCIL